MESFYRNIVRTAWNVTRNNFFLWPLAFLTSLIGVTGTFQIFFDIGVEPSAQSTAQFFSRTDFLTSTVVGWSQASDRVPWTSLSVSDIPLVFAFLIVLTVILTLGIVTISSQGGLIFAIDQLARNKKTTFLESFRHGLDRFWNIFIVLLSYRLLYLLILGLLVIPLAYLLYQIGSGGGSLLVNVALFVCIVPIAVIFELVSRYAVIYLILKRDNIFEAISDAWLLFRTNWLISIETSILVLGVLLAGFLVLTIIVLPVLSLLFTIFGAILSFSEAPLQFAAIVTIVSVLVVVAFFISFFTSLQTAIWVGVFNRLTKKQKVHSKTHRLVRHLPRLHNKVV